VGNSLNDIPPLLHDAMLNAFQWDRHLKTLNLSFECLRRNVDGTPIEDRAVDLRLGGVERVVAHYSPSAVAVKPSEFEPGSRITLADLEDWRRARVAAYLAINSPQAEFDVATACVRETLLSDCDERPGESQLRVHVGFQAHGYGPQGTITGLLIDCDSLEPFANGIRLDVETWSRQFEVWWAAWRRHWAKKHDDGSGEQVSALENTIIPAGLSESPDLSYRPPQAAPFLVPRANAPADLIQPIEKYHTGFHARDWLKVAAAYPYLDHSPDERADSLQRQFLGWNHGRWVYVRRVDRWWCEGDRACVVVRGIEHAMGDEKSRARNEETVVTYGLRRFRQSWVIATWSQGWPRFGSAERLAERQPWRDGWNLAEAKRRPLADLVGRINRQWHRWFPE
jgi:hypothetical protein